MNRKLRPRNLAALSVLYLISAFIVSSSSLLWAALPNALEAVYAEAVLAYNSSDHTKALRLIEQILKKDPRSIETLELKALTYKTISPEQSIATYRELIRIKIEAKATRREVAPYYFEIGSLGLEKTGQDQKKNADAKSAFTKSIQGGFNVGASHFFLGILAFQDQDLPLAEKHFKSVLQSDTEALKPAAHFYLAQIAVKSRSTSRGMQHFVQARDLSESLLNHPDVNAESKASSQQILTAAQQALAPMGKRQYFGSATWMNGYDSNVLALPDTTTGTGALGKSTVKSTLQASVGLSTSPLEKFQYIPSYRFNFNKNFNKDSRTGEYFIQTASLVVHYKPLYPFTLGYKLEATHTFQNSVDPATDDSTFRPLSLNFSTGPSFKYELNSQFTWGGELLVEPQKYYTDDKQTSNNRLSGLQMQFRNFLTYNRGSPLLNPTLSLTFLRNDTDGQDFRAEGITLGAGNVFYLNDLLRITTSLDLGFTQFDERSSAKRNDTNISFGVTGSYRLASRTLILTDTRYMINQSNVTESYQYKKFTFLAGLSYSFL